MSCYVKLKTRITDLGVFSEALTDLGFEVERRPAADRRGDLVLSVTGRVSGRPVHFDVAQNEGEPARLLGDNQQLSQALVDRFHQAYAEKMVLQLARARGFEGVERREVDGDVVLTVRKWSA